MRKIKSLKKNMIIFLMVFSLCLTPFFNLKVCAEEIPIDLLVFYTDSVSLPVNSFRSSVYFKEDSFQNALFFLDNLPTDRFYKVKYQTVVDLNFSSAVVLNSLDLDGELNAFNGDVYDVSLVNFDEDDFSATTYSNYEQITDGFFIIHNYVNYPFGEFPFKLNLSYAPRTADPIQMTVNVELKIQSVEMLTQSEAEIYQNAYSNGFSDGKVQGYSDGKSYGYDVGYDAGYDAAYDAAYDNAYDDIHDNAYNQGVQDGQNSVDTDQYYDHGFLDGVNSVDTDSFYQAGYQAGLTSGYDAAYSEGYNSGFNLGYAEAYKDIKNEVLEDLGSSGTSEGEKFTVVQDLDISDSNLTFNKANTTLPSVYEYESDFEYELLYSESFHEFSDYNGDPYGDSYTTYESMIESQSDLRAFSYYYSGAKKLFTADPSAYAYKVELQLANTSYEQNNILWARNTIGKWSDIMSGKSELGLGFSNGSVGNFTYYIVTDNIPVDIYSAILFYYKTTDYSDTSFDLSSKMTFKITPYSRNEYAAMMQNMDQNFDDLEDALAKEFDDLKNGYDSSDGDNSNNDLDDSLDGFSEVEDSLFEDSKTSLNDFEFFDFNSVPAMLTGISFVTASMTSIYNAMGGNSGIGIILSVLFSVMLISICLGIYKRYQSKR